MRRCFLLILLGILGFSTTFLANYIRQESSGSGNVDSDTTNLVQDKVNGVWISYLELQEFSKKYEINEQNYRRFMGEIYDNCVIYSINHVFVHVRPFADALYPSDYFPWSHMITGQQGKNPGFDPLKIMIEEAHKRNIKFHAWINPYRVTNTENVFQLDRKSNISLWMSQSNDRNVIHYDQQYFLNPAKTTVRKYIVDGIKEIIENYPVDGIHFDDYFYPTFTKENIYNSFDYIEYYKYKQLSIKRKNRPMSLPDWRRNNVTQLVKNVYRTIQRYNCNYNRNIVFGISPVGNLDCLRSDYQYYVDIDRLIKKKGYVDYICPQIYWGFQNPEAPFDQVLNRWYRLCKDSHVNLYVGLPAYKVGTKDNEYEADEFKDSKVIDRMIRLGKKRRVKGFVYYRYNNLHKLRN